MQAPEILEGSSASAASDVYAFGLVMWEFLTWQQPWQGQAMYMVSCAPLLSAATTDGVVTAQILSAVPFLPCCTCTIAVQIPQLVINGGRPAVPSRPDLPGPDTSRFAGLDAYLQLMR